ncbi:MAG: rod shape-determining protein MreC [Saprospiraceae bacterium]|jgi:rod shape-determining protein MreC
MQQIIYFFIKNKNFLLFALLFTIAFIFTLQSHSYHNSKLVSSTNFFSGKVYTITSNVTGYFDLKKQNELLLEENSRLLMLSGGADSSQTNTTRGRILSKNFEFTGARVINNVYAKTNNHITINKGRLDSLEVDMGVITSKGLVGVINKISGKYGRIQSILNTNSQINAQLKKSKHFGFLTWNTKNPNIVQLTEIPKLAPIAIGDTIITGGNSSIFPKGILIGQITDYSIENNDSYTIDVRLFNDMTNLSHVYIIKNRNKKEIIQLEATENAE